MAAAAGRAGAGVNQPGRQLRSPLPVIHGSRSGICASDNGRLSAPGVTGGRTEQWSISMLRARCVGSSITLSEDELRAGIIGPCFTAQPCAPHLGASLPPQRGRESSGHRWPSIGAHLAGGSPGEGARAAACPRAHRHLAAPCEHSPGHTAQPRSVPLLCLSQLCPLRSPTALSQHRRAEGITAQ